MTPGGHRYRLPSDRSENLATVFPKGCSVRSHFLRSWPGAANRLRHFPRESLKARLSSGDASIVKMFSVLATTFS
jgi:hypothetical protein